LTWGELKERMEQSNVQDDYVFEYFDDWGDWRPLTGISVSPPDKLVEVSF
jgi:hypothetical protein